MTGAEDRDTAERHELTELYARYTHAFDEGQGEELAGLFTADGAFLRAGAEPIRGPTALADMVRAAAARPARTRHLVSAILVTPHCATATGTAYVQVLTIAPDAVRLAAIGCYRDEFVRHHDQWRFRLRRFTPFTGAEISGSVLAGAPEP